MESFCHTWHSQTTLNNMTETKLLHTCSIYLMLHFIQVKKTGWGNNLVIFMPSGLFYFFINLTKVRPVFSLWCIGSDNSP